MTSLPDASQPGGSNGQPPSNEAAARAAPGDSQDSIGTPTVLPQLQTGQPPADQTIAQPAIPSQHQQASSRLPASPQVPNGQSPANQASSQSMTAPHNQQIRDQLPAPLPQVPLRQPLASQNTAQPASTSQDQQASSQLPASSQVPNGQPPSSHAADKHATASQEQQDTGQLPAAALPPVPTGVPLSDPATTRHAVPQHTHHPQSTIHAHRPLTRSERVAVPVVRPIFWDAARAPQRNSRVIVRERFRNALFRYKQLKLWRRLYEYSPIPATHIRIMLLEPSEDYNADLRVSLHAVPDDDVGPDDSQWGYEALSYHWGSGPAENPVFIKTQIPPPERTGVGDFVLLKKFVPDFQKGQRFYIRSNLDKALRYLRDHERKIPLWVDAICINQADVKGEKPAQIDKMKTIYSKAENVCIWLGDGKGVVSNNQITDRSADFAEAMNFTLEIVRDIQGLEDMSKNKDRAKNWSDLIDLIRCSWFSRRWVIQELALARSATVHCGTTWVDWTVFADAIALLALHYDNIGALFYQNPTHPNELDPLGAKVLVDAITNTFRKSLDHTIFEPVSTLEALVSSLARFESSDPRDTIYALLNISRESLQIDPVRPGGIESPRPDYDKDLIDVYTDFLEWVVSSTHSIDIICRHWAIPERTQPRGWKAQKPFKLRTLPSWTQTSSNSIRGPSGRINGDSIVGRAGRKVYNACHGKLPVLQFGMRTKRDYTSRNSPTASPTAPRSPLAHAAQDPSSTDVELETPIGIIDIRCRLRIRGFEMDNITWAFGPVAEGLIQKQCLDRCGGVNLQESIYELPDKLWRTLVADRDAEGQNTPPWYHRAALHAMALVGGDANGHFNVPRYLQQQSVRKHPKIIVEYLKRVQAVTWNRKFIESTKVNGSDTLFGLGPPETEVNDRICILFGCSVPCILRPLRTNAGDAGVEYFQFIGEAYIYGKMDGEAVTGLSKVELEQKTRDFVII